MNEWQHQILNLNIFDLYNCPMLQEWSMPVPASFKLIVSSIDSAVPDDECKILYELTRNIRENIEEVLSIIINASLKHNYNIIKTIKSNKDLELLITEDLET